MQSFPLEEPKPARKSGGAGVKALMRILVSGLFLLSCYGAAKLAIKMASKDLPSEELTLDSLDSQENLSLLGTQDEPLFMGSDKEAVRSFFNNHTTLEARVKASLEGTGIRRIQESLEVQTMRAEADAIQVRVSTGAVAGAVYWVHHTQVKEDPAFAPIISPIPKMPGTGAGEPASSGTSLLNEGNQKVLEPGTILN